MLTDSLCRFYGQLKNTLYTVRHTPVNDIINCLEDPNDSELVLCADDTNIFTLSS